MASSDRGTEKKLHPKDERRQLTTKVERLGTRVSTRQKEILQRAADLTGRSLTDFVISSAMDKAQDTIRAYEVMELSERDFRAFFEALQNPPQLNEKIYKAMRWHHDNVEMR